YYWQGAETILTDSLDIGKLTDETLHNYTTSNSKVALHLYAAYEGEKYLEKISHDGYAIPNMVEWTAQILPQNKGVRLLRTFDYSFKNQKAKVYVDDELVGEWLNPGLNMNGYIRDDIFDIPAQYTYGKSFIHIKIVNTSGDSPWTELYYKVYTRVDETGPITDVSVSVTEKPFRVYPTITKGGIQIQATDDKDWSWQVFDLNGKMIQQGFNQGAMTGGIDLSQQASGIYFVRIMQADGSIQAEKVVLTK
ncbi:MAG: T9SS type A sorting domain-containing protein, partial [Chitinophagales bacterium]|nr:T9SS type A sorting domain-containing protein [Chitinophagales bacterium]